MGMIKRIPHCSHWGAYTILVEDDRIVGVEPFEHDPAPSPIIHSIGEWAKPDRRVLSPMVREGWLEKRENSDRSARGRERFVPVSWDEATSLVAGEIRRVADLHGNASIFAGSYGWTSCGRFHHSSSLLKRMLNLVGGFTRHVDTYSIAAGPVILRHTLGDEGACGGQANTLDTIAEHTETLVVFGALSPRTAQNEAGGIAVHSLEDNLRRIADRGVRVILVSPLRDDIPDWVNAEWWPIRPNTDTALMLGLAGEILRAGRQDDEFLARCTSGFDRYRAYLHGSADGAPKDADWAAAITGLDAGLIRQLAHQLVETRSMLTVSWSLQRAHHGEQPFWAALGLASLIGQIGLPGGGVGYGYASLGGVGAAINLGKSPAISQLRRPIDSFIPVARISDMLLNPGATFTYQGEERTYPDTRLVYWAGGNPYHHHQDINRLSEAWSRPETIIVQQALQFHHGNAPGDPLAWSIPIRLRHLQCHLGKARRCRELQRGATRDGLAAPSLRTQPQGCRRAPAIRDAGFRPLLGTGLCRLPGRGKPHLSRKLPRESRGMRACDGIRQDRAGQQHARQSWL